jgi:hypothetical protein
MSFPGIMNKLTKLTNHFLDPYSPIAVHRFSPFAWIFLLNVCFGYQKCPLKPLLATSFIHFVYDIKLLLWPTLIPRRLRGLWS